MQSYDVQPVSDLDVLACLQELPPLAKPHWSWPFDQRLTGQPKLMEQVIRVLGASGLGGNLEAWRTSGGVVDPAPVPVRWRQSLVTMLGAAQKAKVGDLVINFAPWGGHWTYPEDPRYNDPRLAHGTPRGLAEIDRVRAEMTLVRDTILAHGSLRAFATRVACVWIDQETFKLPPNALPAAEKPAWLAALKWCNDSVLDVVREVFSDPATQVVQHARGLSSYYTPQDKRTGNFSIALYDMPDVGGSLRAYRDACEAAAKAGITAVYPVLSLGGVYWRTFHRYVGWQPYEYRPTFAWTWGSYLNDPAFSKPATSVSHAPFGAYAHRVMLWPRAMSSTAPAAGLHLVAYCCGAAGLRPDWIAE